jgi:hypothetical protein
MGDETQQGIRVKKRGFIVWCLIVAGVLGFLGSLWGIAFGDRLSSRASSALAQALAQRPEWWDILANMVGGVLGLLMAWQFFQMSRKILWVLYITLAWCVIVGVVELVVNPASRAAFAAAGFLPLLFPIVLSAAIIWYAHYLDGHGRLGA